MSEFSFLDVDVEEAQELKTADDNSEQDVAIADCVPEGEKCYVLVYLHMYNLEFHKRIKHFLAFPKPDDDEEKKNNKLLRIKSFYEAFNIEGEDRHNPDAWEGRTARVVVGVESDQEKVEQFGQQNRVKTFLVPRA